MTTPEAIEIAKSILPKPGIGNYGEKITCKVTPFSADDPDNSVIVLTIRASQIPGVNRIMEVESAIVTRNRTEDELRQWIELELRTMALNYTQGMHELLTNTNKYGIMSEDN